MKAIKDCEWEVKIDRSCSSGYWWESNYDKKIGLESLRMYGFVKLESSAKKHWEKFALINKIKKWKYV